MTAGHETVPRECTTEEAQLSLAVQSTNRTLIDVPILSMGTNLPERYGQCVPFPLQHGSYDQFPHKQA